MNLKRRRALNRLMSQIESAKSVIEDVQETLATLIDEEREYQSNMPDSLQTSDIFDRSDAASDNMENAQEEIGNVIDELESVYSSLTEASE